MVRGVRRGRGWGRWPGGSGDLGLRWPGRGGRPVEGYFWASLALFETKLIQVAYSIGDS